MYFVIFISSCCKFFSPVEGGISFGISRSLGISPDSFNLKIDAFNVDLGQAFSNLFNIQTTESIDVLNDYTAKRKEPEDIPNDYERAAADVQNDYNDNVPETSDVPDLYNVKAPETDVTHRYVTISKSSPQRIRVSVNDYEFGVTRFEEVKVSPHKVKDDERVKEITVHVYKQAMKVFDGIKKKTINPDMKKKVDLAAKTYKDKFTEFVQHDRETDVRTKQGNRKAILHTIDVSNLILQRLVNFLKADMDKVGNAPSDTNLQKDVDAEVSVKLAYPSKISKI